MLSAGPGGLAPVRPQLHHVNGELEKFCPSQGPWSEQTAALASFAHLNHGAAEVHVARSPRVALGGINVALAEGLGRGSATSPRPINSSEASLALPARDRKLPIEPKVSAARFRLAAMLSCLD